MIIFKGVLSEVYSSPKVKYHDLWWVGRGGQSITREEVGRFFALNLPEAVLGNAVSISFSEGYFPFVCWKDARLMPKGKYTKPGCGGDCRVSQREREKISAHSSLVSVQACEIYFRGRP